MSETVEIPENTGGGGWLIALGLFIFIIILIVVVVVYFTTTPAVPNVPIPLTPPLPIVLTEPVPTTPFDIQGHNGDDNGNWLKYSLTQNAPNDFNMNLFTQSSIDSFPNGSTFRYNRNTSQLSINQTQTKLCLCLNKQNQLIAAEDCCIINDKPNTDKYSSSTTGYSDGKWCFDNGACLYGNTSTTTPAFLPSPPTSSTTDRWTNIPV